VFDKIISHWRVGRRHEEGSMQIQSIGVPGKLKGLTAGIVVLPARLIGFADRCRRGSPPPQRGTSAGLLATARARVMPLRIEPAGGTVSPRTGLVRGVRTRLAGLGLTLIALGPPLVIATAVILIVFAVADLIRPLAADVADIAAIVESRISPQIAAIESAVERLGAPLSQLQSQIEGALSAVEQVGDVHIAAGQWGRTPSVRITIPPDDLSIASVPETHSGGAFGGIANAFEKAADKVADSVGSIKTGQVFDQATPTLQMPPVPIALSMAPVQQALAPLGPNGAVGKAVKAAESEVGAAIAEVGKLRQPILAIRDDVANLLAPLQAVVGPLVSALVVVAIAVVVQLVACGVSVVFLLLTHPVEFVRALIARGPIGLLPYCSRAMLLSGFANAFARKPPPPHEHLIDALRERAVRLQSEIAALHADFAGAGASTAAT
jgi:hypothetical protein